MKAIIDNWRYDTEAADEVAACSNGNDAANFNFCREVLYRTRKGAWFIHGMGGPKSKYAETNGSTTSPGERIVPLANIDARQWLERHRHTAALEKYFANVISDA